MRYPDFLKQNGTIGFVAPSFGCAIEPYKSAFDNAQNKFKNMGYNIKLGANCYAGEGIGISNTPQKCGEEFMEMYCDSSSDVLISCGGGELMCETLDYIDFDKIAQSKPKWYLGYSDNTHFTFLQTTICDTASVYGPCAATFGMEPWHNALYDTFDVLTGKKLSVESYDGWELESLKSADNPLLPFNITQKNEVKVYNMEASFSGRLIGGCMDCLVNILGTKYDRVASFNEKYKDDGIIWFLESCDLNVFSIRRAMWQMENAGWFKYVKGFVIGRPLVFGQEMMGLNQYEAVMAVIRKYNVPVIMDADIGHLAPSMPVVCGSVAQIGVTDGKMTMDMRLI